MQLTQDRTEVIKRELAELHDTLKMSVQKAIRIGELLTEQKEFIGHGNFLFWLDNNLDISERTAQKYMVLFRYQDKTALNSDLQAAYNQIETLQAQERAAKNREKMSQDERDRSLIAEYRKTGAKPLGWTDRLDKRLKDDKAGYARQQERIDELKREQNRKSEEEKTRHESVMNGTSGPASPAASPSADDPKRDYYYNLGKISDEMLKNASTARATHTNKRNEWKEKIRLSDGGKEDAFLDAIIDYMETLENDNRRIEACNNIIKICRNISVELQRA